ncbi:sulfatase family protein [Natronolimnohabitans innermongolicus]|uniref:Sulfatase n=1 Tax=Natronolimnohabitans innermongolicus JCM 12255 TaxID=1227499 RepID=L9WX60_9EURY|nr:sulfatase [Natronolimnohabitans innermongolicus]ELY54035.1 sulfatase [Natronolimnohabitans innermongolicus JCM 12255]
MEPPNIVLVHCHDLGTYLGCYGAAVETPRIDALAADGVRFDNHYVTAPQCSPSRSSLMTGRHPHQNGMLGLAHAEWELGDDERVLPDLLSAAGYETHRFGLQHVTEYPERLGYDRLHSEEPLTADAPPSVHETARARTVADDVAAMLESGDHDDPFFASIGFFELHRVEEDDGYGFEANRYETPDPETVEPLPFLPDRPGIRSDIAEMHGMVGAIDDGVGTIVDALEDAGLAEDTLVVFTTEHGLAMPRAKGCCFEAGIEGALLARWPGVLESGRTVDDLVSNVDVFATLLEIAGVSIPDVNEADGDIAGRSIAPLLLEDAASGGEYEPRERLFAGMTWHDRYNPVRAIRTERWKYVRNCWHLPGVYMTTDVYCSAAGREVCEEFYGEQRPYEELYDLANDPLEQRNLLGPNVGAIVDREPSPTGVDPESASVPEPDEAEIEAVHGRLREELCDWMRETDDPLLDGPVLPSDWDVVDVVPGDGPD